MSESDKCGSGTSRIWDHEDCPRDGCDGELQQQDKFNVMCLSCEGVWTHCKTETKHYLQTVDFETVAEKPIAMADGGISRTRCGNCGRFCGVTYKWRGPSYSEVVDCPNCGPKAFQYDPFAAAIEDMSDEEVKALVE